jgi:hypothetical protein
MKSVLSHDDDTQSVQNIGRKSLKKGR